MAALDTAGFGSICRAGYLQVDHALVTALVERWRPETHTFHLRVGEATITLGDVAILWGLRVEGEPVTGGRYGRSAADWISVCERLLGFQPELHHIQGNRLEKAPLEDFVARALPNDADDAMIQQRARGLILLLIGGLLFSDKSGHLLPLRYLPLLEDLHSSGRLSWGSAVLAYLYRCLCTAAHGVQKEICGPMVLLQLWAWEHIPIFRPDVVEARDELPALAPYSARWDVKRRLTRSVSHVLVTLREQLDSMRDEHFVWYPYRADLMRSLPAHSLEGQDIWRSRMALICWEIVEFYYPNRVMRQFRMVQAIPDRPNAHLDLHAIGMRGSDKDWSEEHKEHLQSWRDCRRSIQAGTEGDYVVPGYMDWFRLRTRWVIGNRRQALVPNGNQGSRSSSTVMVETVQRVMDMAGSAIPQADSASAQVFAEIRDMCARVISTSVEVVDNMASPVTAVTSTTFPPAPTCVPRDPIKGRGEPGRRRGGKRRRFVSVPEPNLDMHSGEVGVQVHFRDCQGSELVHLGGEHLGVHAEPMDFQPLTKQAAIRKMGDEALELVTVDRVVDFVDTGATKSVPQAEEMVDDNGDVVQAHLRDGGVEPVLEEKLMTPECLMFDTSCLSTEVDDTSKDPVLSLDYPIPSHCTAVVVDAPEVEPLQTIAEIDAAQIELQSQGPKDVTQEDRKQSLKTPDHLMFDTSCLSMEVDDTSKTMDPTLAWDSPLPSDCTAVVVDAPEVKPLQTIAEIDASHIELQPQGPEDVTQEDRKQSLKTPEHLMLDTPCLSREVGFATKTINPALASDSPLPSHCTADVVDAPEVKPPQTIAEINASQTELQSQGPEDVNQGDKKQSLENLPRRPFSGFVCRRRQRVVQKQVQIN